MAVGDEASLRPTEGLLLQDGRKHYRTQISPIHWQLRSLISAERDGIIYFPAGPDNTHITRLNTRTNEYETIKVISFPPRCLVASGGWICCGGESGEFIIIRETAAAAAAAAATASAADDSSDRDASHSVAPHNRSLTSELSMNELRRDMLSIVEQINGSAKTWSASSFKFGTQRVNCITIWQPPKPPSDQSRPGVYTSPVAVLANNDKTITIVNLADGDPIDELELPDCVNRGVISPDGSFLVAICDDPFLYIHVRCGLPGKRGNSIEWLPLPRIRLQDQSVRDISDCRGSFAACFSPSGRYLAVGTQYGTISIFDVSAFTDPDRDALVTFFNSARAPNDSGAVRDMAFSPGPYDVLAWTEHRGRVGVADARTNFTRRQIISIEDHGPYHHVSLTDRNTTIDPRLLDPRSEQSGAATSPSIPSLLGQSSRLQPRTDNPDIARLNQAFSPEEAAILQAVQNERSRRERAREREQRDQRESQARNAAWRSPVFNERVSPQPPRTPRLARERDRDTSERLRNLTTIQRDTLTRVLERDHQRSTTMQAPPEQDRERRAPTPRRRSSITQVLAQNVENSVRLERLGNWEGPAISRDNASAWGQAGRSTSGWADLEVLYSLSSGDASHDTNRRDINRIRRALPIISDLWSEDGPTFRRIYGRMGHRDHQQHVDDTAGLTWSEDGRTLYVGAEDGIYEFRMNMLSRKLFPTITLR